MDAAKVHQSYPMAESEVQANKIVDGYVKWSAAAGLIPIPLLDMAFVAAIGLKMVKELADHYKIPFDKSWGKAAIGALLGAALPANLGLKWGTAVARTVPGVGVLVGLLVAPAMAAAATYALGRVFIQNFAAGGTLLDFNASEMIDYFKQEFGNKMAGTTPA